MINFEALSSIDCLFLIPEENEQTFNLLFFVQPHLEVSIFCLICSTPLVDSYHCGASRKCTSPSTILPF